MQCCFAFLTSLYTEVQGWQVLGVELLAGGVGSCHSPQQGRHACPSQQRQQVATTVLLFQQLQPESKAALEPCVTCAEQVCAM